MSDLRWVALLRGVNVGAHHRVTMATVREAVAAMGGRDVTSHIQSGNVLLAHPTSDRAELSIALQSALAEACGFPVPVLLRSGAELAELVVRDPFGADHGGADYRRYVTFLGSPAEPARVEAALGRLTAGEAMWVTPTEVCGAVRRDVVKPVHADLDRLLKVTSTARAWNVVEALASLATR